MFSRLRDFALTALAFQTLSGSSALAAEDLPAPELSYLYTAYVYCRGTLMNEDGPKGTRRAIPIVGGNFTGPRLSGMETTTPPDKVDTDTLAGQILDLGADWGTADPKTGIFSADTRYNLRTDDGADIFIQTSGPKAPSGNLHLRLMFETGHEDYYWLNSVLGEFAAKNRVARSKG